LPLLFGCSNGDKRFHRSETTYDTESDLLVLRSDMKPINGIVYEGFLGKNRTVSDGSSSLPYETDYKNGKRDGFSIGWYSDDQIRFKQNHKEGKDDGLCERWHSNGQLEERSNSENGELISEECWSIKGDPISCEALEGAPLGNYKDEKRNGIWKQWDHRGILKWEGNYKDGKKNGVHKKWVGEVLRTEYNYRNDEFNGIQKEYYIHNSKQRTSQYYKDGLQIGLEQYWYENGQLRKEQNRNNKGEADGWQKYWYENGQLMGEINMRNGSAASVECWSEIGNKIDCSSISHLFK